MKYRRIVIATDKFKGSLTAGEAAAAIHKGISDGCGNTCPEILSFPMADGGEGSLELMKTAMENAGKEPETVYVPAVNHLGRPISVPVLLYKPDSAFIEMAKVCGLGLVPYGERDLAHSTTYGLGETARIAIEEYGAREILLSIGGSGTNDGGFGMISALGFRFANDNPFRNKDVPTFMESISSVVDDGVDTVCPHLRETKFRVACDVSNPLLGPDGASRVYGPQKGGTPEVIEHFEKALGNWADVVERWGKTGKNTNAFDRFSEGAGAAGGTGFILGSVLNAEILPGWEFFASIVNLEKYIASADLVITGEGRFDESSLSGKLPWGIASLCRKYRKPLWMVTGRNCLPESIWRPSGFNEVFSIDASFRHKSDIFANASEYLTKIMAYKFKSM